MAEKGADDATHRSRNSKNKGRYYSRVSALPSQVAALLMCIKGLPWVIGRSGSTPASLVHHFPSPQVLPDPPSNPQVTPPIQQQVTLLCTQGCCTRYTPTATDSALIFHCFHNHRPFPENGGCTNSRIKKFCSRQMCKRHCTAEGRCYGAPEYIGHARVNQPSDYLSNKPLPIRPYRRSRRVSHSPPSHSIPPALRSSSVGTSQQAAATALVKNSLANPLDCEWKKR
ncbi:hypothetical protein FRC03_003296 [Tulasnella sp. 419]|nr:hypothetical protein FRC03_003296 [Tulasnella sp. 419]